MKHHAYSDSRLQDRHVSWVAALWAALALLAAAAVLLGTDDTPAAHATTAVAAAAASTHPALGTPPSDPAAPAASDQLAPTP